MSQGRIAPDDEQLARMQELDYQQALDRAEVDALYRALRDRLREGHFFEAEMRRILTIDPDLTPPTWISYDVRRALDGIKEPNSRRKRTTIIRLAEAAASGVPMTHVFDADDTCSRPTWYGNKKYGQAAWRDMEDIQDALEAATRAANHFYDAQEGARLNHRRRILEQAQDRLAELSGVAVETLGVLMTTADGEETRRKAAVDTLTHAAPETAPKQQSEENVLVGVEQGGGSGLSMRDIRNKRRRRAGRPVVAIDAGEDGDGSGADDVIDHDEVVDDESGAPVVRMRDLPSRPSDNGDSDGRQAD